MPTDIDSLQIQISADASIAEKSLNRLAESLAKLSGSINGINTGNFNQLAGGVSQLATAMQQFSSGVKTVDFTRIATGLNKLSTINLDGVTNASNAIRTLVANLSNIGTITFDAQGIANMANAIARLGRGTVTTAAENIPRLAQSLRELASAESGIGNLQLGGIDFEGLERLASAISKLGSKSATTAASGNIINLANALRQMMSILSGAPQVSQNLIQMTQALAQLAATGNTAGTATNTLSRSFSSLPASTTKARKSMFSLASAFGRFYATYWLLLRALGQFKKAIDISSDLTEVQNVVDKTFGDMAYKVEELSDTSIQDFGMSELTVKQISSRFQAMGTAMGFAQGQMSDMSVELTKLAADMASFYNVEQADVAEDLEAIFTGQTRPLILAA